MGWSHDPFAQSIAQELDPEQSMSSVQDWNPVQTTWHGMPDGQVILPLHAW
jgi:hypothetical protein